MAHFFAAIAYEKRVLLCEQYMGNLNGTLFSEFVRKYFPDLFKRSNNPKGKIFLQDGDPSQNSRKARVAILAVGASKFSIPARSPDLNPIENIFHLVKRQLHEDALEKYIMNETFEEFSDRIKRTMNNISIAVIDKTILSMDTRVTKIIQSKGNRIKY